MRPKSQKPRIPAQNPVRAYTDDADYALKNPEGDRRMVPEPEAVEAVEVERMAKANHIKFQTLKAEEREQHLRASITAAANREWAKHIGGTAQVGGTIILGDFRWIRP